MPNKTAQTSIGLAAARIVNAANATPNAPIIVKVKTASGIVLIGGSDVSSANGYTVSTTADSVTLTGQDDLYAVATQTATLQVFYNER